MTFRPAFDFLSRPRGSAKPRTRGFTLVSDKANSLAQFEGHLETVGDVIDHVEIPGFGL